MRAKNTSATINNHGGFGRWAFLEIVDPWGAKNTIRAFIAGENVDGKSPLFKDVTK